jgi:hypothetical protein
VAIAVEAVVITVLAAAAGLVAVAMKGQLKSSRK